MNIKRLSQKEKERLFCRYYLALLNPELAAERAALPKPAQNGPLLLTETRIQTYLKELAEKNMPLLFVQAILGYYRLAFSSTQDAVHLLNGKFDSKQAEQLDLFSVSEIKTSASGVQIKFFDRQKALDKLCELTKSIKEDGGQALADALCDAIHEGAKAISGQNGASREQ